MYRQYYGNWKPVVGDEVFASYDGKYGRRVVGVITKRQGCTLTITFKDWDNVDVTLRANRRRGGTYAGWAVHDGTLMDRLFGSKSCPGDWYSVLPYKVEDDKRKV